MDGCIPETLSGDFLLFCFLVRWVFRSFLVSLISLFFLLLFGHVDFSLFSCVLNSVFDPREDNEGFFTMVSCVNQIFKFYRFCRLINMMHSCSLDCQSRLSPGDNDDDDDNVYVDDADDVDVNVDDDDVDVDNDNQVGRIKEIIIPAGGENVAPVNIEEEIKSELQEVPEHSSQSFCHF